MPCRLVSLYSHPADWSADFADSPSAWGTSSSNGGIVSMGPMAQWNRKVVEGKAVKRANTVPIVPLGTLIHSTEPSCREEKHNENERFPCLFSAMKVTAPFAHFITKKKPNSGFLRSLRATGSP